MTWLRLLCLVVDDVCVSDILMMLPLFLDIRAALRRDYELCQMFETLISCVPLYGAAMGRAKCFNFDRSRFIVLTPIYRAKRAICDQCAQDVIPRRWVSRTFPFIVNQLYHVSLQ